MTIYTSTISTPLGNLGVIAKDQQLTQLTWVADSTPLLAAQDEFNQQVVAEITQYFHNPNHLFKLPYQAKGTPFQEKVWQALLTIPRGETRTYGDLAKQLKTSPRAIGRACRTNPIPILIPCHRIVGQTHLGGYDGETSGNKMSIKSALLAHEK